MQFTRQIFKLLQIEIFKDDVTKDIDNNFETTFLALL